MALQTIDISRTGMLFFDILNGFFHATPKEAKERLRPMVDNAVRLMKASRSAGIPIFFAKSNHRPDSATTALIQTDTDMSLRPWPGGTVRKGRHAATAGESSSDVIPELEPQPDDYYIPKFRRSAFHQTYFDLALRTRGIDTLILSGCHTDIGVAATIFAARDMDYNVIVVRDACATVHDQRAHDVLVDLVFPRIARIRTTDQVLALIQAA